MIYKQKGSKYYWTKFQFQGATIRKATKATNAKSARKIENKIRTELSEGRFGILQPKEIPTLAGFLKEQFLPFVKVNPDITAKTREYYQLGSAHLLASRELSSLALTEIDGRHLAHFASRNKHSISTLNRNLRTLRHALHLAEKWKTIDRAPRVNLAPGEIERDRIITNEEMKIYLFACLQPWRDIASIMFILGMRPGEIYALRWEQIDFENGFVFILRGKTKSAKRQLPLEPIRSILEPRFIDAGLPKTGWVFPANTKSGHFEQGSAKNQHNRAIAAINKAAKEESLKAGVTYPSPRLKPFAPYSLRHTALTALASVCDTFSLKTIAGHSNVRITERYVHPQAKAIAEAFKKITESQKVVIAGGHSEIPADKTQAG